MNFKSSVPCEQHGRWVRFPCAPAIYCVKTYDDGAVSGWFPWLLAQVMEWFASGRRIEDPTVEQQYDLITEHYDAMLAHYGNEVGVNMARKHIGWYTKGLHGSAEFRNRVNQISDPKTVQAMLAEFYAPWRSRAAA